MSVHKNILTACPYVYVYNTYVHVGYAVIKYICAYVCRYCETTLHSHMQYHISLAGLDSGYNVKFEVFLNNPIYTYIRVYAVFQHLIMQIHDIM